MRAVALRVLLLLLTSVPALHGARHFSTRGDGVHRCASAADQRVNCTRCAPGWRGLQCNVPVFVAPCTPHHCLDWSRCPWGQPLTLHVHAPPPTREAEYVQAKHSHVWRDILRALTDSPRHVTDASLACLLVPWMDTLCTSNDCTSPSIDSPKADWLVRAVEQLPLWQGGTNHVLFDMSSNHAPRLPVGRGIYMATSFWAAGTSYRHGHDQPLPLWNQQWERFLSADAARARRARARSRLLVFKGQRMFWCSSCAPHDLAVALKQSEEPVALTHGWVRNQLHLLHNGRDVVTVGTCARELKSSKHCDGACRARCRRDALVSNATHFHSLLCDSAFGLVLPGITPMSYRLAETMACGAVPVIVSDFMRLPLPHVVDWPSLSFTFPERMLARVPELLRAVPAEEVHAMRLRVSDAYERCFASPGRTALCGIEDLERQLWQSSATG